MLFLLANFALSDDICPCEVFSGRNPGCCCSGLTSRSQYPEGCYPEFPSSILPSCPEKHWRKGEMDLKTFLIEELFCISRDNRDVSNGRKTDSYEEINETKYKATYYDEVNEDAVAGKYSAGSKIRKDNGKFFLLPTSGASIDCAETLPLRFLYSVDGKKCRSTSGITLNDYEELKIPTIPGTENYATISFNDDETNTQSSTAPTDAVKQVTLIITYSSEENHAIKELCFHYLKAETTPSTFTLSVKYVEENMKISWSSGEIGYSQGSPIIAARYEDGKILIDDELENNVLPIAIGSDCSSALYKVAKYGKDTFGACGNSTGKYEDGKNPLLNKKINAFAKHSHPDPTKADDWYILNDLDFDGCTDNSNFQYLFYTKKAGTSKRPIELIEKVKLTCIPDESDTFKVTTSFIPIPQDTERDIGDFPVWLATLPNDTWAPFA